jgi:hypothetical protein
MLKGDLMPNATINRWIQGILLFDFTLVHVPASKFHAPDALSRRPVASHEIIESDNDDWLDDVALLTLIPDQNLKTIIPEKEIKLQYAPEKLPSVYASRISQEKLLKDIKTFLKDDQAPLPLSGTQEQKRFYTKTLQYFIKKGKMYKQNKDKYPLQVIFDPETRISILSQAHDNLGHRGVQAVFETLRRRFYWPHLRADVQHHVQSCHECQLRSLKRREIPITISAPTSLFQKVYIDVMHMPRSQGFRYIVAARDDLSGTCEAQALLVSDSNALADFFWNYIYCRYGAPQRVVTDNGGEVQKAFQKLLLRMDIP